MIKSASDISKGIFFPQNYKLNLKKQLVLVLVSTAKASENQPDKLNQEIFDTVRFTLTNFYSLNEPAPLFSLCHKVCAERQPGGGRCRKLKLSHIQTDAFHFQHSSCS